MVDLPLDKVDCWRYLIIMAPAIYSTIVEKLQGRRQSILEPMRLPIERELAKDLNVGRDTVRRALSELEKRGAVTRRRGKGTFLQPVKVLPNGSLKGANVGFIPPWWADSTSSWFTSTVFEGVARWADEHKCNISVLHADRNSHDAELWMKRVEERDIAGVVWVHPDVEQLPLMEHTARLVHSVVLGRSYPNSGLHHVIPDYNQVVELIDSYLVSKGHREYSVIGAGMLAAYSQNWLKALQSVAQARGSEFDIKQHFIDIKPFVREKLAQLLLEFYEPGHPQVHAFVLASSSYLLPLIADETFRRRMTEDISIVTFDYGLYPMETYWPGHAITHVTCDWPRIGRKAMDILDMLAAGRDVPEVTLEPVGFAEGDTVRPCQAVTAVGQGSNS